MVSRAFIVVSVVWVMLAAMVFLRHSIEGFIVFGVLPPVFLILAGRFIAYGVTLGLDR
jgi:hypothetical protein